MIPQKIAKEIKDIVRALKAEFENDFLALILYGSWAKGMAREDSDIDLLAIFERVDRDMSKRISEISSRLERQYERTITLLPVTQDEFKVERLPLFTAVKREGIIIFGDVDFKENLEPPETKYKDFFKKSLEFESKKVEIAERMLQNGSLSGVLALCFMASKHLLQAGLAIKGVGFSSKVKIFLPLIEEHFNSEVANAFKRLFSLYIKAEYQLQLLDKDNAILAVEDANRIINVIRGIRNVLR